MGVGDGAVGGRRRAANQLEWYSTTAEKGSHANPAIPTCATSAGPPAASPSGPPPAGEGAGQQELAVNVMSTHQSPPLHSCAWHLWSCTRRAALRPALTSGCMAMPAAQTQVEKGMRSVLPSLVCTSSCPSSTWVTLAQGRGWGTEEASVRRAVAAKPSAPLKAVERAALHSSFASPRLHTQPSLLQTATLTCSPGAA